MAGDVTAKGKRVDLSASAYRVRFHQSAHPTVRATASRDHPAAIIGTQRRARRTAASPAALVGGLYLGARKRWITEYVGALVGGQDCCPVGFQCVPPDDAW